ncbi:MAG: hypothetical protein KDJ27_07835 [Gammaproteobacteria bacterium]|nr:hypothetical protein [Gammaproteobacteria bacterium]MCB1923646.1 hypothetical protein [Gammaproteobacteria bacterium]
MAKNGDGIGTSIVQYRNDRTNAVHKTGASSSQSRAGLEGGNILAKQRFLSFMTVGSALADQSSLAVLPNQRR